MKTSESVKFKKYTVYLLGLMVGIILIFIGFLNITAVCGHHL